MSNYDDAVVEADAIIANWCTPAKHDNLYMSTMACKEISDLLYTIKGFKHRRKIEYRFSEIINAASDESKITISLNSMRYAVWLIKVRKPSFPHIILKNNGNTLLTWAFNKQNYFSIEFLPNGRCKINYSMKNGVNCDSFANGFASIGDLGYNSLYSELFKIFEVD